MTLITLLIIYGKTFAFKKYFLYGATRSKEQTGENRVLAAGRDITCSSDLIHYWTIVILPDLVSIIPPSQ